MVISADDIEVVHRARPGRFEGSLYSQASFLEQALIFERMVTPLLIPPRQMRKLYVENPCLERIQPPVVSFDVVVILLGLPMIPNNADLRGDLVIVGGYRAGFATGT